jgi:GH15 family glucan-1,4-alpha-glucosidase
MTHAGTPHGRLGRFEDMPLPIEDYAIVGDTGTAALIGRDGSVDWLCLPRFDSPACFAALLGDESHGRWLLGPRDEFSCERRYIGHSAVLETTYTTATGKAKVVDAMPINDGRADLVRQVIGLEGTVTMRHEWRVRFEYGRVRPWVHRADSHGIRVINAVAGPDRLILRGTRLPHASDHVHVDEFDVSADDEEFFTTTWVPSHHAMPRPLEITGRLTHTQEASERWAARCAPCRRASARTRNSDPSAPARPAG